MTEAESELLRRMIRPYGHTRTHRPHPDLRRAAPGTVLAAYGDHDDRQRPHRALQLRPPHADLPAPDPDLRRRILTTAGSDADRCWVGLSMSTNAGLNAQLGAHSRVLGTPTGARDGNAPADVRQVGRHGRVAGDVGSARSARPAAVPPLTGSNTSGFAGGLDRRSDSTICSPSEPRPVPTGPRCVGGGMRGLGWSARHVRRGGGSGRGPGMAGARSVRAAARMVAR